MPYSAITGDGFQSLCQTLVNYGGRFGRFDVRKAMPDRSTIARHVPEIVEATKADVRQKLSKAEYIALTSDGWTDDFHKISYVTVTATVLGNATVRSLVTFTALVVV